MSLERCDFSDVFRSKRYVRYILLTQFILNNFSLLPTPLHVPYREKDEDDDLEKVYKEVGVWCLICRPCWIIYQRREAFSSDRSQYLDFLRLILAICCLVKGFSC